MKNKFEAMLANTKTRTIFTVAVVVVIVITCIGIGSTLAASNSKVEQPKLISEEAAQEIAFNKAGGGILKSLKTDTENGVKIYKVEIVRGEYEYDIEVNALTGEVTGYDQERVEVENVQTADTGSTTGTDKNSQTQNTNSTSSDTSTNANSNTDSTTDSDNNTTSSSDNSKNYIGKSKAKSIALNKVGGGNVIHCHLEYDDGIAEYDVKIIKGNYEYEFEINAKNGKILDYDRDRLDDEDDDDDDDYDD